MEPVCAWKSSGMDFRLFLGLLLFPVAEMYFFRCGDFLGCKAGLSLLRVFFLPRPVFFLPRTRFFPQPPECIFSAAKVLFCCCQVFFLSALNFSRCEAAFFADVFPRCGSSFFPLQGVFFLLPNVFFSVPMFFSCCEPVFFARYAETRARERRVIHLALATCKLDSAGTSR